MSSIKRLMVLVRFDSRFSRLLVGIEGEDRLAVDPRNLR